MKGVSQARHTLNDNANRVEGWAYYEYDDNGSLTSFKDEDGQTTFAYDDNSLCEAIVPDVGDAVYFYYDGRLTRYAMDDGATTTYFTWDGINILEFTEGGTKTVLTHGYTPIAGIGSVVEEVVGGTKQYHHCDQRGTTVKVTDENGDVTWTGLVDAFGVEFFASGTPPSIFWYQGETWFRKSIGSRTYYVSPTRLYDTEDGRFIERDPLPEFEEVAGASAGAAIGRWEWLHTLDTVHGHHDPETGRWRSRDPLAYLDGIRLYEFTNSSPFTWTDSLGLQKGQRIPSKEVKLGKPVLKPMKVGGGTVTVAPATWTNPKRTLPGPSGPVLVKEIPFIGYQFERKAGCSDCCWIQFTWKTIIDFNESGMPSYSSTETAWTLDPDFKGRTTPCYGEGSDIVRTPTKLLAIDAPRYWIPSAQLPAAQKLMRGAGIYKRVIKQYYNTYLYCDGKYLYRFKWYQTSTVRAKGGNAPWTMPKVLSQGKGAQPYGRQKTILQTRFPAYAPK